MIKRLLFLLVFPLMLSAMSARVRQSIEDHIVNGEREMAIIVPTYNNSRSDICLRNLDSVLGQHYENVHIYIVNDCSSDDTAIKIARFLKHHPRKDKVTLIDNKKRVGAMANYYKFIHALEDHVIVLNVDGDDWLNDPYVLDYINSVYADMNIWLTYGQYVEHPRGEIGFCRGYPKIIIKENSYRTHGLPISHLRTYYAWLFKLIEKKDLMFEGEFVQATCDKVLMVPMIEMSAGRFRCIDEVLYVYNATNPLSDMYIAGVMQGKVRDKLFLMAPYEPLCDPITDYAVDA